ncbi:uncharacterized protein TRIADDRAFT_21897, partial [Trichoplax adhaerens]
ELKFPKDVNELKRLVHIFHQYQQDHYWHVLVIFVAAYLYKQTFSIPGSVFTNIFAGAVFGLWQGFLLASVLTAAGATSCFLLSKFVTKTIIGYYFPNKMKLLREKAEQNSDGLFFFLLSLRFFPMTPNWFLNVSLPAIGVPITYFFFSVLIGLMPYNYICCQAGLLLSKMTSVHDLLDLNTVLGMIGMAVVAFLPGAIIRNRAKKTK